MHRQSRPLDRRTALGVFARVNGLVRQQVGDGDRRVPVSGTSQLQLLVRRAHAVVAVELANPSSVDGFPAGHGGGGGGGGGPTMVIEDDRVPVTPVEMAVLAGRVTPDPFSAISRRIVEAFDVVVAKVVEVEGLVQAAERLQAATGLTPLYDWVAQMAGLPFDERWAEIHKRTTFAGYLERPLDEPRPVCRWTYDFVRAHRRLPSRDEMLQLLRTGKVKVHV